MTKAPKSLASEPTPQEPSPAPPQQPPQPPTPASPPFGSVPPPPPPHPQQLHGAMRAALHAQASADDPINDANVSGIIREQRALITSQMVQVVYLNTLAGLSPPPPATQPVPPDGSDTSAIIDTLAGASRALGAYISQLNTLNILWPPGTQADAPPVNGNGGSP